MAFKDRRQSVNDMQNIFLGTLVEARNFIYQLESTFSNELWPAFSGELAKSNDEVWKLEKMLDESKLKLVETARAEKLARQRGDAIVADLILKNADLQAQLDGDHARHRYAGSGSAKMPTIEMSALEGPKGGFGSHAKSPKSQTILYKTIEMGNNDCPHRAPHTPMSIMNNHVHVPPRSKADVPADHPTLGPGPPIAIPIRKHERLRVAFTDVTNKGMPQREDQSWRSTRSSVALSGEIPLDSFLATPQEAILCKIAMLNQDKLQASNDIQARNLETVHVHKHAEGKNFVSTRGLKEIEHTRHKNSKAPAFKFNDPVRKKRDHEELLATDCKQCKKFYDAIANKDGTGVNLNHCEHMKAVSRHRFQNLPPNTPEGFWNIGFDSSG